MTPIDGATLKTFTYPARLAYYYALRLKAREVVARAFLERFKAEGGRSNWDTITLASIDLEAIDHARLEWPKFYAPDSFMGFAHSWDEIYRKFSMRPSFFDLAIWQQIGPSRVLQGLAIGRPSRGKSHLTINWVERSFAPTYMRGGVLLPILACAEEYGKLLGCGRVLIKNPIDPAVYAKYGYETYRPDRKVPGRYLVKELRHGKSGDG